MILENQANSLLLTSKLRMKTEDKIQFTDPDQICRAVKGIVAAVPHNRTILMKSDVQNETAMHNTKRQASTVRNKYFHQ